jgi:hypothetical protein
MISMPSPQPSSLDCNQCLPTATHYNGLRDCKVVVVGSAAPPDRKIRLQKNAQNQRDGTRSAKPYPVHHGSRSGTTLLTKQLLLPMALQPRYLQVLCRAFLELGEEWIWMGRSELAYRIRDSDDSDDVHTSLSTSKCVY